MRHECHRDTGWASRADQQHVEAHGWHSGVASLLRVRGLRSARVSVVGASFTNCCTLAHNCLPWYTLRQDFAIPDFGFGGEHGQRRGESSVSELTMRHVWKGGQGQCSAPRLPQAQAGPTLSLADQMALLRCYYNFIRPHGGLKFGRGVRTPAMQAGLAAKRLTLRDVFTAAAGFFLFVAVLLRVTRRRQVLIPRSALAL